MKYEPLKVTTAVRKTPKLPPLTTARDDYLIARKIHRDAIRAIRVNIKRHRLLIRQAKTVYKLSKCEEKR